MQQFSEQMDIPGVDEMILAHPDAHFHAAQQSAPANAVDGAQAQFGDAGDAALVMVAAAPVIKPQQLPQGLG